MFKRIARWFGLTSDDDFVSEAELRWLVYQEGISQLSLDS